MLIILNKPLLSIFEVSVKKKSFPYKTKMLGHFYTLKSLAVESQFDFVLD